jgi:pilus assembly protein CpaE
VTELTLAAARDSIRILSWLKSNAPGTKVIVVANRVQASALEISRKDFEQSIERKIDVIIPADSKLAAQAAKLGKTLADVGKSSKIGHALESAMNLALGAVDETDAAPAAGKGGKSLLGKITDLKSIIPARKK